MFPLMVTHVRNAISERTTFRRDWSSSSTIISRWKEDFSTRHHFILNKDDIFLTGGMVSYWCVGTVWVPGKTFSIQTIPTIQLPKNIVPWSNSVSRIMNVQLLQVKFSTFHLRNAYILSKWTMSSQIMVILIPCNCDWSHHLKRHGACQVDYKAPNQHDYNYYKLVWFSHNKQFPHSLSHTIVFYLSLANPVIRIITVLRPLVPNLKYSQLRAIYDASPYDLSVKSEDFSHYIFK